MKWLWWLSIYSCIWSTHDMYHVNENNEEINEYIPILTIQMYDAMNMENITCFCSNLRSIAIFCKTFLLTITLATINDKSVVNTIMFWCGICSTPSLNQWWHIFWPLKCTPNIMHTVRSFFCFVMVWYQWPLLLTWFNFNPSMDK